jgi:hypothetical protein
VARIIGAIARSRARSSERRSPRFEATIVEDHPAQVSEEMVRIRAGEQQSQLLGRRQEDVGRIDPLALALRHRGVARSRLDAHAEPEIGDRAAEVTLDVDGQRLQRRDVERVEARPRAIASARPGEIDQRRQKAGESLAGAGRRDEERVLLARGGGEEIELMLAGHPAALGEPGLESCRKQRRGRLGLGCLDLGGATG